MEQQLREGWDYLLAGVPRREGGKEVREKEVSLQRLQLPWLQSVFLAQTAGRGGNRAGERFLRLEPCLLLPAPFFIPFTPQQSLAGLGQSRGPGEVGGSRVG